VAKQSAPITSSINREKVTFLKELGKLPDGTFLTQAERPEEAILVCSGKLKAWTPSGYVVGPQYSSDLMVTVLTPASTVNAFRAGYVPQIA
jgi:hypothetical protein